MSRIRVPTETNVRKAGYTVVRWYSKGAHARYQHGWITDEREVPTRGKKTRTECRVEFVDDRTRWLPKEELEVITPATKRAAKKAMRERLAAQAELQEQRNQRPVRNGSES